MNDARALAPWSAERVAAALRRPGFPLSELVRYPVSAIEPVSVQTSSTHPRGVCSVRCLGCCAAAAAPSREKYDRLTPDLFGRILAIAKALAKEGLQVLSTIRLTLYSASNELDNPDCIQLRKMLTRYFEDVYGFPLGGISSDLAFHVSKSPHLHRHLRELLTLPTLWDNICFSIDEQLPIRNAREYADYLDRLRTTWLLLEPALTCQLGHARVERLGAPRVILNMLVPGELASFQPEHRIVYPGGPFRAVNHQQLVERYVEPFVGKIVQMQSGLPSGHRFTSGIAGLSRVRQASVYVAYNRYAPTGRASALVQFDSRERGVCPGAITTKLYAAGAEKFRFCACFATAPFADDEVQIPIKLQPDWVRTLNAEIVDTAVGFTGTVHTNDGCGASTAVQTNS